MTTKLCPSCQEPLGAHRTSRGIYWACPRCVGHLVSLSVLRQIANQDDINFLWKRAWRSRREAAVQKRACPNCRSKMIESFVVRKPLTIALDTCVACATIWFDTGEYEELLSRDVTPSSGVVALNGETIDLPLKAKKIIATARIEHMKEMTRPGFFSTESPEEGWKIIPALLGMPVTYDDQALLRAPAVTWTLAATVLCTSIIAFARLSGAITEFGFIGEQPFRHFGLTLFSSFFIHAGWLHLLVNIYFLLLFGPSVEEEMGAARFFVFVALAAAFGNFASITFGSMPVIGASGGAYAVMVYHLLRHPFRRIGFYFWARSFFAPRGSWLALPSYSVLILSILFEVLASLAKCPGYSGRVAHSAHLGGALVGLFWFLLSQHRDRSRSSNHPAESPPNVLDYPTQQPPLKIKK